jgi:hypothetical protein
MATRYNYTGGIVTNGLVLNLDAAKVDSYPGTGTTWNDISGNNNNGTLTNGPTFSGIGKQAAIVFDGTDDYVVVNNFPQLPVSSSARTINIWFNPNALTWQSNINNLFFYGTTGTTGATFGIDFDIYPVMEIYTWGGNGKDLMFSSSFAQTGWANIAVTYDGSTSIKIYENGTNTQTLNLVSPCNTGNTNVWIGSINPAYQPWYYDGKVSVSQIYNRALSAAEVSQNFNALRGRYGI